YHNQPDITREKLQDGWLRTGDVFGKDPDGFYFFMSRVDDMFVCGGENVYPKEVENLLFAHPDVVNAVVAPVPHRVKGFAPAAPQPGKRALHPPPWRPCARVRAPPRPPSGRSAPPRPRFTPTPATSPW